MKLNSGIHIPSMFNLVPNKDPSIHERLFENNVLRVGLVKQKIEPSDPKNINRRLPEYEVITLEQNGEEGTTYSTYPNCLALQSFGGIGDFFEYTYRPQDKTFKNTIGYEAQNQTGAFVLLLCINGRADRPVIVGALPHPDRDVSKIEKGNVLKGEFNGLGWGVDNNGAFNVTFKGATDSEGKVLNKDLGESTLKIEKDGSIQLNHKTITLRLDKNGNTTLAAQGAVSVQAQKTVSIDAKEDISIKSAKNINLDIKDLMAKASGSATYEIQSFKLDAKSDLNLKSQRLDIKTQLATIKGTQITLDGLVFLGGAGGVPALSALTQMIGASAVGPVVSFAVGPYASKVFVS